MWEEGSNFNAKTCQRAFRTKHNDQWVAPSSNADATIDFLTISTAIMTFCA